MFIKWWSICSALLLPHVPMDLWLVGQIFKEFNWPHDQGLCNNNQFWVPTMCLIVLDVSILYVSNLFKFYVNRVDLLMTWKLFILTTYFLIICPVLMFVSSYRIMLKIDTPKSHTWSACKVLKRVGLPFMISLQRLKAGWARFFIISSPSPDGWFSNAYPALILDWDLVCQSA